MTTGTRKVEMRYSALTIRHKIQGIVMITCAVALAAATAVFTLYDRRTFLAAKTEDLVVSAQIIGANISAAIAFQDPHSAGEILSALRAKKHVVNACIYDSAGKVFAKYSRDPGQSGFSPPAVEPYGVAVTGGNIVLFQLILLNQELIGTIYIQNDL